MASPEGPRFEAGFLGRTSKRDEEGVGGCSCRTPERWPAAEHGVLDQPHRRALRHHDLIEGQGRTHRELTRDVSEDASRAHGCPQDGAIGKMCPEPRSCRAACQEVLAVFLPIR